ncbi:MAG TPA: hypothetical protein VHC22_05500 [Pirellulales bacterium]|nr:hypothetical protein [Pirellulales bacterium]
MRRPNLQLRLLVLAWLANAGFAAGDEPRSEASTVKPPIFTLIGAARTDSEDGQLMALTLEVVNPNDASIRYTGYAPDSFDPPLTAKCISPLFQIEIERDGKWQPNPHGFCGTGMGNVELAARSSATFVVHVPADDWQAVKVAIGHYPAWSQEETSTTTIWSTEIARTAVDGLVRQPMRRCDPRVGKWSIDFANGVTEMCVIRDDGTATVAEPQRTAGGKVIFEDGSMVIHFDDDRVERWTTVGKRQVVEHWFPAAHFPAATPVLGIAEPCDSMP